MSVSKLTNAEARRLLDMTKRSLIAELNFLLVVTRKNLMSSGILKKIFLQ